MPGASAIFGIVIEKSLSVTGTVVPPLAADDPAGAAELVVFELELEPHAASISASAPTARARVSERLMRDGVFMVGDTAICPHWISTHSTSILGDGDHLRLEATRRWRDGWRPSVWLFDFDGTLVDSVELILDSYRYTTATVLGETPPEDVRGDASAGRCRMR